jgi:hypothetical protein
VVLSYVEDGKMKEYNNEQIEYLGTTAHGYWDIRPLHIPNKRTNPRMEGNRVLAVYDRTSDPWDTHHISFAGQLYKNVKKLQEEVVPWRLNILEQDRFERQKFTQPGQLWERALCPDRSRFHARAHQIDAF